MLPNRVRETEMSVKPSEKINQFFLGKVQRGEVQGNFVNVKTETEFFRGRPPSVSPVSK